MRLITICENCTNAMAFCHCDKSRLQTYKFVDGLDLGSTTQERQHILHTQANVIIAEPKKGVNLCSCAEAKENHDCEPKFNYEVRVLPIPVLISDLNYWMELLSAFNETVNSTTVWTVIGHMQKKRDAMSNV